MRFILITAIIIAASTGVFSQSWTSVNPEMTAIFADTNLVLAYVASIEPGKKSEMHTHAASFIYTLTDCKLKVYYSDGQSESFDLKPGMGMYADPEKLHQTENTGDKTAKFLLVELKEHPYK